MGIVENISAAWSKRFGNVPKHYPEDSESLCTWTKLQYAVWIEKMKESFKRDDLVTLNQIPVTPNIVPMYYTLSYIEENHNTVKYDLDIQQPIAFVIKTQENKFLHKCPAVLRKLTTQEIALVNLSNQRPQGTA